MLSEEEKEAVEYFNTETKTEAMHYGAVLVKLIEKQSKEIEELKEIYQTGYVNGCVSKVYEINKKWKDKIKAMLENEIINISGFECVAKGDVQSLLEKE